MRAKLPKTKPTKLEDLLKASALRRLEGSSPSASKRHTRQTHQQAEEEAVTGRSTGCQLEVRQPCLRPHHDGTDPPHR